MCLTDQGHLVAGVTWDRADSRSVLSSLVPIVGHPCVDGYWPVMIEDRGGVRRGFVQ